MRLRMKVAATVFLVASVLSGGVATAAQKGTWSPAGEWNGLTPSEFRFACEAMGGTMVFEGTGMQQMMVCKTPWGEIYCDRTVDLTTTNCRRYKPRSVIGPTFGTVQMPESGTFYTAAESGSTGDVVLGGAAVATSR